MYKYWVIYRLKGDFRGFQAVGFNHMESITMFQEDLRDELDIVDVVESNLVLEGVGITQDIAL